MTTTRPSAKAAWSRGYIGSWITQFALSVIGVLAIADDSSLFWLLCWCGLASLYAATAVSVLGVSARRNTPPADSTVAATGKYRRWRRILVLLFTVIPTLIGITAAIQVIVFGSDRDYGVVIKLLSIWAMLLAWGFLHWGFAQIYQLRWEGSPAVEQFDFPSTPHPGLVDFVYFAYTIGTTFAASDVNVLTTRTRWLVTVHSVMSFFVNALLIGLTFNIILSASSA